MFIIDVPYFSLDQIYNSKQAPRWIKLKESKYVIPFRNRALKIEQQGTRLMMSCSEKEFYDIWFHYFDLSFDYCESYNNIKQLGGKIKKAANRSKGIHIIKQDDFEAYVYAEMVCKVGYDKAIRAMNHISEVCGVKHIQSMREAGRVTWYEWPTAKMIIDNFDKLKKMGEINSWLKELCEAVVDNDENYKREENDLYKLFAKHDLRVFPINEIDELLAKNFECIPNEFADWYLYDIKEKGLVYMYILHNKMNPPKKIKEATSRGVNRQY